MVLSITTFLILRGCLKGVPLDSVGVLADISLKDLAGNWLATLGEKTAIKAHETGKHHFERLVQSLEGPASILTTNDDLQEAERRAFSTALRAFHAALECAAHNEHFTPGERHWVYLLGFLSNDIGRKNIDCFKRLRTHVQSALGESSVGAFLQVQPIDAPKDIADYVRDAVHCACLAWLEREIKDMTTPMVDSSTPVWVKALRQDHPDTIATCPALVRQWLLEPSGFCYYNTQKGDWWRKLLRRPPVKLPLLRMTLLQAWTQCYREEVKSTSKAFNEHLLLCLDALKTSRSDHVTAIEEATKRLEEVTTSTFCIEQQFASLLGLSTENFAQINAQGAETHNLLTSIITDQAEQSATWQRISQKLNEIISHLQEEHGPPIDDFNDLVQSTAEGASVGLGDLVYRRRWIRDLLSREVEIQTLLDFLNSDDPFLIHILVGEAGMGKSRLALELVLLAQREGWRAGFLQTGFRLNAHRFFNKWNPTVSTLLIIDYASEQGADLARALAQMTTQERNFIGRLRVILIDRPEALPPHINDGNADNPISQDRNKEKVRQRLYLRHGRQDISPYVEQVDACCLNCLNENQWEAFLIAIFARAGHPDRTLPQNWKADVARATGGGRPLMLAVLGLHYLKQAMDSAGPNSMDKLLDEVIQAEVQDRWLRMLHSHLPNGGKMAEELLPVLEQMIALVTLTRGLSLTTAHRRRLRHYFRLQNEDVRVLFKFLKHILGVQREESGDERLRPLEPDLLAERFMLRGGQALSTEDSEELLSQPFSLKELIPLAMELDPGGVVATLALVHRDYREAFPELVCSLLPFLRDDSGICDVAGGLLPSSKVNHPIIKLWVLASSEWSRVASNNILEAHSASPLPKMLEWSQHGFARCYASFLGAVSVASIFQSVNLVHQCSAWDEHTLLKLLGYGTSGQMNLELMPDTEGHAFIAAHAIRSINFYEKNQQKAYTLPWGNILLQLHTFPDPHLKVKTLLANHAVNALAYFGKEGNMDKFQSWLIELVEIAKAHPDHEAIQIAYAKGSVNAITAYERIKHFEILENWALQLESIAKKHPENVDIQIVFATGSLIAISAYGKIKDWESLERWASKLIDVAKTYPLLHDVRLSLLQGLVKVVTVYSNEVRLLDLERWRKKLYSMLDNFVDNIEMSIELSKGAIIAIDACSKANDWAAYDQWVAVLSSLVLNSNMTTINAEQIYGLFCLFCFVHHRDKRPSMNGMLVSMRQKYKFSDPPANIGDCLPIPDDILVANYNALTEEARAEIDAALNTQGTSIEELRQK